MRGASSVRLWVVGMTCGVVVLAAIWWGSAVVNAPRVVVGDPMTSTVEVGESAPLRWTARGPGTCRVEVTTSPADGDLFLVTGRVECVDERSAVRRLQDAVSAWVFASGGRLPWVYWLWDVRVTGVGALAWALVARKCCSANRVVGAVGALCAMAAGLWVSVAAAGASVVVGPAGSVRENVFVLVGAGVRCAVAMWLVALAGVWVGRRVHGRGAGAPLDSKGDPGVPG
jgi:hypothetical protein